MSRLGDMYISLEQAAEIASRTAIECPDSKENMRLIVNLIGEIIELPQEYYDDVNEFQGERPDTAR